MRPSCCSNSRPSKPSSTTTTAAALLTRQQLQGVPVVFHGVVPGYSSSMLEAQSLPQRQALLQRPICRLRALRLDLETPVEPGQELLQHSLGLLHGGRSGQPEFRGQPVLKGSRRPLYPPLGLGRQGEYQLDPQLLHRPAELGGCAGGLVFRAVLEDRVAVGVEGERDAPALDQAL